MGWEIKLSRRLLSLSFFFLPLSSNRLLGHFPEHGRTYLVSLWSSRVHELRPLFPLLLKSMSDSSLDETITRAHKERGENKWPMQLTQLILLYVGCWGCQFRWWRRTLETDAMQWVTCCRWLSEEKESKENNLQSERSISSDFGIRII